MEEDKEQQIVEWAMGLLSESEAEALEREFAVDPELKAFALEMKETVASISLTARRIRRPLGLAHKILRSRKRRANSAVLIPWALAACLAVVVILLGLEQWHLRRQVTRLETEQQVTQLQISTLQSQLATYRESSAVIVWDPNSKTGVVQFEKMPSAGAGKDYQLWVVDPALPAPVSAGILPIREDETARIAFKPNQPVNTVAKFVVSVEPAGGVPKSVGPAVLVSR